MCLVLLSSCFFELMLQICSVVFFSLIDDCSFNNSSLWSLSFPPPSLINPSIKQFIYSDYHWFQRSLFISLSFYVKFGGTGLFLVFYRSNCSWNAWFLSILICFFLQVKSTDLVIVVEICFMLNFHWFFLNFYVIWLCWCYKEYGK